MPEVTRGVQGLPEAAQWGHSSGSSLSTAVAAAAAAAVASAPPSAWHQHHPRGGAASEAVRGVSREVCRCAVRRAVSEAARALAGRVGVILEAAMEMAGRACACEGCRAKRGEGGRGTASLHGGLLMGEEEEEVEVEDDMQGEQGGGERGSRCILDNASLHVPLGLWIGLCTFVVH